MIPVFLRERPFLPLATERLILRPLEDKDAAPLAALADDKRVAERLARLPHPYTLADAHSFIAYAQDGIKNGTHVEFAVIRRADQAFMGVVGLEGEIGYWLGRKFWGQNYGKEAVKALVHFAFFTLQQENLFGAALTDNLASRRIFEGLGFEQTGTKECTSRGYEGTRPGVTYALSQKDFLERHKAIRRPIIWAVAAALINEKGELLLAERPADKSMAGVWEPPGGKMEIGETPEEALVRELKEEVGIDVKEEDLEPLIFLSYSYDSLIFDPSPSKSFHLVMPLYLCRRWEGTPHGAEGQRLAWVTYADLARFPLPPADVLLCHRLADVLITRGIWSYPR
ncbi:MAG: GNAT family N-acetyltransferase [Proteobacteria bacterium]|nr:GNAT family N-acetyltransferase [Pseudomonadota bacterium]